MAGWTEDRLQADDHAGPERKAHTEPRVRGGNGSAEPPKPVRVGATARLGRARVPSGLRPSAAVRSRSRRRPVLPELPKGARPRYGFGVSPCFDVYVWIRSDDRPAMLFRFVEQYVDRSNPGDPRFEAFLRTFVAEEPSPGDAEALADLRRDADAGTAFSLYLRGKHFHEAIVTITEEGDVVLGLGLDDPLNDPGVERQASDVLARLVDEFGRARESAEWICHRPNPVPSGRKTGSSCCEWGASEPH